VGCAEPYVGCDGGVPATAIEYITAQHGVATAISYPYVALDYEYNAQCEFSTAVKIPMTPSYEWLNDDASIKAALALRPISACVAVGGDEFQFYESGVMDPTTACDPPDQVNHAITPVGYGVDSATNIPYWLIKNSWASDWGENGYFRLRSDITNSCGIAVEAISVNITIP